MGVQEQKMNQTEREAVYRIRELFAQGREASLSAAGEEEEAYVRALSERALYPEKPILSFVSAKEEGLEQAWNPKRDDMEFFCLAERLKSKKSVRRFITCGGVDDGKSTLIGRILYDTKSKEEQEAIRANPLYLRKDNSIDYALLAGTSEEEARQGITVNVSYSAFDWEEASFLMADVPGHEEYTHHMAYAASKADTAIIMLAANKGIVPQTRRHTRICHFMGIRNMIFAINKMDMVKFDEAVFVQLAGEIGQMMEEYKDCCYKAVPVAAKSGENMIAQSEKMPWHTGGTLLFALGRMEEKGRHTEAAFCMLVQRTCKSSQMKGAVIKKRVIQGEVFCGSIAVGDEVFVYPTARRAKAEAVYELDQRTDRASAGSPIGIELDRELDVARGYILAQEDMLTQTERIEADILWTFDSRLTQGKRYLARIGTMTVTAAVTKICYQKDVNTGEHGYAEYLTKNALGRCEICFPKPIAVACEKENRALGTFRLEDRETNALAAYGNIVHTISKEAWKEDGRKVTPSERETALGQKAGLVLFHSGERAGEHMNYAERYLLRMGFHTIQADFKEMQCLKRCLDAGLIVLVSLNPSEKEAAGKLLEDKKYMFDCTKMAGLSENMGIVLKRMKEWASELI